MKNKTLILIVEDVLALITLVSLVSIAAETVPSLKDYSFVFEKIEFWTVIIFSIEYLVRIFSAKRKLKYIFSFYGLVDLLSIAPTILGFGNLVWLKSFRIIRISRLFRMLRVFKFSEVAHDIQSRERKESRLNLFSYIRALFTLTVVFGGLMHIFESHNNPLSTLPKTIAWALKVLVGGTPLIETYTMAGQAVLITARFSGFILIALFVFIIRNWIMNKYYRDF
jgi:voltage-gated potassium channel